MSDKFIISLSELQVAVNDFIIENQDSLQVTVPECLDLDNDREQFSFVVGELRRVAIAERKGKSAAACRTSDTIYSDAYRDTLRTMINDILHALMYAAVYTRFKSVPSRYQLAYDEVCTRYTYTEVTDALGSNELRRDYGIILFDGLYLMATSLLTGLKLDEWAMVDFNIIQNTLILNVGESVKNEIFNRIFGTARWEGAEFDSCGNIVDGDFDVRLHRASDETV